MKKSWSSYGPTRSSVTCCISPFSLAGSSSGLIGVSTMSRRMPWASFSNSFSAAHLTRLRTNVFGIPAFTPYIDMWSPLYVHHPRASSDKSPVPITMPFVWLAMSMIICVLSRACEFSYVASLNEGSCEMSLKCCSHAGTTEISRIVIPRASIRPHALPLVREVVPKPGIVTPIILSRVHPNLSAASTVTRSARVLSSPPEIPSTADEHLIWLRRVTREFT